MKNPLIWIYNTILWPMTQDVEPDVLPPLPISAPTFANPPNVAYHANSKQIHSIDYRQTGIHPDDNPTIPLYSCFYTNGDKSMEWWEKRGYHHRLNGPASIDYYENGQINLESWYEDGKKHRIDGPAFTKYGDDGKVWYSEYWIHGEELSYKEWLPKYEEWFIYSSDAPLREKVAMKLSR